MQVTFWRVKDTKTKINLIPSLVQRHFVRGEKILLIVPNEAAARYIDSLLWSHPAESFLPHAVSERPLNAAVLITTLQQNLNQSKVLVHLCPQVSPLVQTFDQVHDIMDETDSAKHALALARLEAYQLAGHLITQTDSVA